MGIICPDIMNILSRRELVPKGSSIATFGRLEMFLNKADLVALRKRYGRDSPVTGYLDAYRYGEYAERFFSEVLDAATVQSLDMSDHEGATTLCDLSRPVPEALHEQYNLVWDGGTLEHIFNVPVALANLMTLPRQGGLVYLNLPCNNLCGHGFYQFSPELMYRVLSPENGFEMLMARIGMAHSPAIETTSGHPTFDVVDPDTVGQRVGLMSSRPAYLMVLAQRVQVLDLFSGPVVQSDYARRWRLAPFVPTTSAADGRHKEDAPSRVKAYITSFFPGFMSRKLRRQYSAANREYYRRVRQDRL